MGSWPQHYRHHRFNQSVSVRLPRHLQQRSPLCGGIVHKRRSQLRSASLLIHLQALSDIGYSDYLRLKPLILFTVSPSAPIGPHPRGLTWKESAATGACLTVDGVMTGKRYLLLYEWAVYAFEAAVRSGAFGLYGSGKADFLKKGWRYTLVGIPPL